MRATGVSRSSTVSVRPARTLRRCSLRWALRSAIRTVFMTHYGNEQVTPSRGSRATTSSATSGGATRLKRPSAPMRRLGVEHGERALIQLLDLLATVRDDRQPQLAELGERADQVEEHARLRRVVVVELVDREDLDQVLRQESAVRLGVQVVRGAIVLGMAAG